MDQKFESCYNSNHKVLCGTWWILCISKIRIFLQILNQFCCMSFPHDFGAHKVWLWTFQEIATSSLQIPAFRVCAARPMIVVKSVVARLSENWFYLRPTYPYVPTFHTNFTRIKFSFGSLFYWLPTFLKSYLLIEWARIKGISANSFSAGFKIDVKSAC